MGKKGEMTRYDTIRYDTIRYDTTTLFIHGINKGTERKKASKASKSRPPPPPPSPLTQGLDPPRMTNITSCRNVIKIEHTASAVCIVYLASFVVQKKVSILYSLVTNIYFYYIYKILTQKNISSFQNLSLRFSLKVFSKFILLRG